MILRPCPGCEGEAIPVIDMDIGSEYAECQTCGFTAPLDVWNTRPIEDELEDKLAQVRKQYDDLVVENEELHAELFSWESWFDAEVETLKTELLKVITGFMRKRDK